MSSILGGHQGARLGLILSGEVFLEVSGVLNEGTEVWIYVRRHMICDGGIVSARECFPIWGCVQEWPQSLKVRDVCWRELC